MSDTGVQQDAVLTPAAPLVEPLVAALARCLFAAGGRGLTAWDALPEASRAEHVQAARRIVQAIRASGYLISRVPDAPAVAEAEPTPGAGVEPCREQAERFLRSGEPLLAYNAVQLGLETWPG